MLRDSEGLFPIFDAAIMRTGRIMGDTARDLRPVQDGQVQVGPGRVLQGGRPGDARSATALRR
ncbi:hypothetical protein HBB16_04435 [Pseudonocardia sp. MCCB 268]|nr:hypothetical protein [Pseudonocardia cytotoxica]